MVLAVRLPLLQAPVLLLRVRVGRAASASVRDGLARLALLLRAALVQRPLLVLLLALQPVLRRVPAAPAARHATVGRAPPHPVVRPASASVDRCPRRRPPALAAAYRHRLAAAVRRAPALRRAAVRARVPVCRCRPAVAANCHRRHPHRAAVAASRDRRSPAAPARRPVADATLRASRRRPASAPVGAAW